MSLPFVHENQVALLPPAKNERVLSYAPDSCERGLIQKALDHIAAGCVDMPLIIDGKAVQTGQLEASIMPHEHRHEIGHAHLAGSTEIERAIAAANRARKDWSQWATSITPPTAVHSHHNGGNEQAMFLIVQDGGIFYHARAMGFEFAEHPE